MILRFGSRLALGAACLGLLVSCGGNREMEPEDRRKHMQLDEISQLYESAQVAKGKPPTKVSDLDQWEPAFPTGHEAVRNGKCIVVWGTDITAAGGSDVLLAYPKEALTDGGTVLMADKTMR